MSNKNFRRLHEDFLLLPNAWDAGMAQAALGLIGRLAHDFLNGSWTEMFANAADYGTTNRLFDLDDREGSAP
jgi:hypothetical protein